MFSASTVYLAFFLYMAVLFVIALWSERIIKRKPGVIENPVVYSLSLSVFLTAWTVYGTVGKSVRDGMLFLPFYIGAALMVIFWWTILRRMIRIKNRYKVTSIADLLSARYGKSSTVAFIATLIAIIGIIPYIALQLKSIITTSQIMINPESGSFFPYGGLIIVFCTILFTILFGMRKVDPTERHPGMTMAIAVEAVFKLIAVLIAGIYITFYLFHGFDDIFIKAEALGKINLPFQSNGNTKIFPQWLTYMFISMSAVLLLPRQFHMAVVENANEKHVRTAIWFFPLYMFVITLFAVPIGLAGVVKGLPLENADTFIIQLPLLMKNKFVAMTVYLGGFSAAVGMVMISTIAISIMASNHLVIPLLNLTQKTRRLLPGLKEIRWLITIIFLLICYYFEQVIGSSFFLANMGVISFTAVLQFAPAVMFGLYWRKGNRSGAIAGLSLGFLIWAYTIFLPSLAKSGWISDDFLVNGLFGWGFLKPEEFLGSMGLDPITNSVFWSLFFNVSAYVIVSLLTSSQKREKEIRTEFLKILEEEEKEKEDEYLKKSVKLNRKVKRLKDFFGNYLTARDLNRIIGKSLRNCNLEIESPISVIKYAEFLREVEKNMSGYLGVALASKLLKDADLYNEHERDSLSRIYARKLTQLSIAPTEMEKKINYFEELAREREEHADELQRKIDSLNMEITERKKIEDALRKSEKKVREIIQQSIDGIAMFDVEGKVLEWNRSMERISGINTEKILNKSIWDFLPELLEYSNKNELESSMKTIKEKLKEYSKTGILSLPQDTFVINIRAIKGTSKDIELRIFPLIIGESHNIGLITRDITELIESYHALLRSDVRTKLIIENSNDAICVLKRQKVVLFNRKFKEMFGFDEKSLQEANISIFNEIIPSFDVIPEGAGDGETEEFFRQRMFEGRNLDGKPLNLEIASYEIEWEEERATVLNIRDITSRLELEQQVNQLQKMDAIGRLAGGIAHDFNNILTTIIGLSELAMATLDQHHPVREELLEILKAGERATGLTRQLLVFSRKQQIKPKIIDPNAIIRELQRVLTTAIGEDIQLELDLKEGVRSIYADISQLEQILMNLVLNARDAVKTRMPQERRIKISTDEVVIREDEKLLSPNIPGGSYLVITVSDNGCGMDEETMQKIFEPFFTTKPKELGTGLGLSTVYGIIKQNKAEIKVKSSPGEGSVFEVYWPISGGKAEIEDEDVQILSIEKGAYTIFIVEDNEEVRRFVERSLRTVGYKYFSAGSGEEALKMLKDVDFHFDLLFTDVILPGINGKELAEKIREKRPEVEVLFGTGYPDEYLSRDGIISSDIDIVYKPYSLRSMITKINHKLKNKTPKE